MNWWKWTLVIAFAAIVIVIAVFIWQTYPIRKIINLQEEGAALSSAGRFEESEVRLIRALDLAETHWDESNTAPILINLAVTLAKQGRPEEAEPYATRALDIFNRLWGPTSTMAAYSLWTLYGISYDKGEYKKSDSYFRELERVLEQEETHPELGNPALREVLRKQVEAEITAKRELEKNPDQDVAPKQKP